MDALELYQQEVDYNMLKQQGYLSGSNPLSKNAASPVKNGAYACLQESEELKAGQPNTGDCYECPPDDDTAPRSCELELMSDAAPYNDGHDSSYSVNNQYPCASAPLTMPCLPASMERLHTALEALHVAKGNLSAPVDETAPLTSEEPDGLPSVTILRLLGYPPPTVPMCEPWLQARVGSPTSIMQCDFSSNSTSEPYSESWSGAFVHRASNSSSLPFGDGAFLEADLAAAFDSTDGADEDGILFTTAPAKGCGSGHNSGELFPPPRQSSSGGRRTAVRTTVTMAKPFSVSDELLPEDIAKQEQSRPMTRQPPPPKPQFGNSGVASRGRQGGLTKGYSGNQGASNMSGWDPRPPPRKIDPRPPRNPMRFPTAPAEEYTSVIPVVNASEGYQYYVNGSVPLAGGSFYVSDNGQAATNYIPMYPMAHAAMYAPAPPTPPITMWRC